MFVSAQHAMIMIIIATLVGVSELQPERTAGYIISSHAADENYRCADQRSRVRVDPPTPGLAERRPLMASFHLRKQSMPCERSAVVRLWCEEQQRRRGDKERHQLSSSVRSARSQTPKARRLNSLGAACKGEADPSPTSFHEL